jgi:Zn-dependent peptidase ImmA (M78 family)
MNLNSSDRPTSPLIAKFIERADVGKATSPTAVMFELVSRLAKNCRDSENADARLQFSLRARNVRDVTMRSMDGSEGALHPLGASYSAGFLLMLNTLASASRRRFTLAHEICHTFFYELVPEIKFAPHEPFEEEEHLCNVGAGELLMPESPLRSSVLGRTVSLDSLAWLAAEYSVSISAMLLRLKILRLWKCELTEWHPMLNQTFGLRRVIGGFPKPWEWDDASVLAGAWRERSNSGIANISYINERGIRFYRAPIPYQVKRFGDRLLALWGPDVTDEVRERADLPLFDLESDSTTSCVQEESTLVS